MCVWVYALVPNDGREDVDYVPLLDSTTMDNLPDYLSEDIAFARCELPKFVKNILCIMIANRREEEEE